VVLILTLIQGPSLIKEYKRRGFIIPRLPWEENYMKELGEENEKKKPQNRIIVSWLAILLVVWIVAVPFFSENLYSESLKFFVAVLAILFSETAFACYLYKEKIYKVKRSHSKKLKQAR
jgi:membrane protein YdbS with pleckstrin-like domain